MERTAANQQPLPEQNRDILSPPSDSAPTSSLQGEDFSQNPPLLNSDPGVRDPGRRQFLGNFVGQLASAFNEGNKAAEGKHSSASSDTDKNVRVEVENPGRRRFTKALVGGLAMLGLARFGPFGNLLSPPRARAEGGGPDEQLTTFVDLPSGATQVPGSNFYYTDGVSSDIMNGNVALQLKNDYANGQGIDPARSTGLGRGSIYVPATNDNGQHQFVEATVYERSIFTALKNKDNANYSPARQRLASILFEGKLQVTPNQTVTIPENVRQLLNKLPITGDGSTSTPTVQEVAGILSTDKALAVDAAWQNVDKALMPTGTLNTLTVDALPETLPLGNPDSTTGHRVPVKLTDGLQRIYKDKVIQNVGLPMSPAFWVDANISGTLTKVLVQVFERNVVTYNPKNDAQNQVQIGLGGNTVWDAFTKAKAMATATPVPPTAQPAPTEEPSPEPPKPPENDGIPRVDNPLSSETQYLGKIGFKLNNGANLERLVGPAKLVQDLFKMFDRGKQQGAENKANANYQDFLANYVNNHQGHINVKLYRPTGEIFYADRSPFSYVTPANFDIDLTQGIDFVADVNTAKSEHDRDIFFIDTNAYKFSVTNGKLTIHMDDTVPWNEHNFKLNMTRLLATMGEVDEYSQHFPEGKATPNNLPFVGLVSDDYSYGKSPLSSEEMSGIVADP